ncbi:unnamed protein product [Adineta steineri]|uniref:Uncharacterized protein n=1 Tax=Adineta steineri TaxID=433720 RepID=A0A814S1K8_9BILA|nr:unnamed protein product [Adineta steineri]CAF1140817.1 unnamed protein product [Adineta steineri]
MSIRYRLKRNSGLVNDPIPVYPDAIYRPKNRPVPVNIPSIDSKKLEPRIMPKSAPQIAPLAANESGYSLWWIIGPLLAVFIAMIIGALVYVAKKKNASQQENDSKNRETDNSEDDNNILLKNMKSNTISKEQQRTLPPISLATKSPSYSESLLSSSAVSPTSSALSSTSNLDKLNDKSSKQNSDANINKKEYQRNKTFSSNDIKKIDSQNHTEPFKTQQNNKIFSPSEINDLNVAASSDRDYIHDLNSPEQHGIGKSPLISSIPTGSKRNEKEKSPKDKISNLNELTNKNIIQTSKTDEIKFGKYYLHNYREKKFYSIELDKDNSDQSNFVNQDKTLIHMPNVPQCKTSRSSDDDNDEFDEFYPVSINNSTNQQKTNSNINALKNRKKRTLRIQKSLTKHSHFKRQNF